MTEEPISPSSNEPAEADDSFRSIYTSTFPALLRQLGVSLAVSTYQAGKLIFVREQGGALNTHFRQFHSPMGLAYQEETGRLAVGAKRALHEFRNQPPVAQKLEPVGVCDAAFMPRRSFYTGDIRIHEIAWIGDTVWAANTRFSCLSTFDADNSFVPRWRPPFISALAPEDRCHLNGMAVVDGRVRYVTCLGVTDAAGGWRSNKRDGGVLLDVDSGEVMLRGLSMPHSPRVHLGSGWILESGHGTISMADFQRGTTQEVTRLPGFTRGLDFCGKYAFIGLSQVRETAVFSGIPLVEELPQSERACGVWVVDLTSGKTVAFLRFEGAVQEIFAVTVLPDIRHPDLVQDEEELLDSSFVVPPDALQAVPAELRSGG